MTKTIKVLKHIIRYLGNGPKYHQISVKKRSTFIKDVSATTTEAKSRKKRSLPSFENPYDIMYLEGDYLMTKCEGYPNYSIKKDFHRYKCLPDGTFKDPVVFFPKCDLITFLLTWIAQEKLGLEIKI